MVELKKVLNDKQDNLTAGENITIKGSTISASIGPIGVNGVDGLAGADGVNGLTGAVIFTEGPDINMDDSINVSTGKL